MNTWLRRALSRPVVHRALIIALVVGPILVLINQGDYLLAGEWSKFSWLKAILTFIVPYLVSTVSSLLSITRRGDE